MGLSGIVPDPNALKPNQRGYTSATLPAEGYSGPYPALPKGHSAETHAWYTVWATSPQAAVFMDTDWQRLRLLAFLVDELYHPTFTDRGNPTCPKTTLMAEIRQNEARLGATIADRTSMYMKVAAPTQTEAATQGDDDLPTLAPVKGRQERMHIVAETG
jgi:hypothetical protein